MPGWLSLALGLEIPEDHPDRNKYQSMALRPRQINSSDVAEITLMSPGDMLFLYPTGSMTTVTRRSAYRLNG